MINPVVPLFQKEIRQNGFIYLFPFILIITALTFQKFLAQLLSATWAKNFAIAIPVALAFSYALQAFDLEENSQTRDFLLTKPIAVSQIVISKFFSGLLVLLPLTILWQFALIPDLFRWPDLFDINSFRFFTYLLLIIISYSFSFTIGAWVKGPQKLLAAVFTSILGIVWFFFGWFEFLTLFYLAPITDKFPISLAILLITFVLLIILFKFLLVTVNGRLLNHSLAELFSQIKNYLPLLLFPLLFYAANLFYNPEIRPFDSLFNCLNGSEEPFYAVDITKQPQANLFALTDVRGRLGIAKRGDTPTVIYRGEKKVNNLLSKPIWAPSGDKIAFNENGIIKVLSLSQKTPFSLMKGDMAFWSDDSNILLVAAKLDTTPKSAARYSAPFNQYRLSYISLDSKKYYELQGNLSFPGSSMFWRSSLNTILAITDFWEIAVMNLNSGKVEMVKMPLPPKPGPIFLTKIAPSGNDSYRIAVFTDLKVLSGNNNSFRYNLQLYDFSLSNQKPVLKASLKDLNFQDVLINPSSSKIWGSNSFGVYRKINLP